MKKLYFVLMALLILNIGVATAEVAIGQAAFENWLKTTTVPEYSLDEESFECYDEKEFAAAYGREISGAFHNLAVKIVPLTNPQDEKNSPAIKDFTDLSDETGGIFYYAFNKMDLSSITRVVPQRNISLVLTASPALSAEEMLKFVKMFDLGKLGQ